MRLPQKILAESARIIGKKKFTSMSTKRQHELLSALAWDALLKNDFAFFRDRYRKLQSWVEIDSYTPPSWLSEKEALYEYISFHNNFTPTPVAVLDADHFKYANKKLSWTPNFKVEVALDQVRSPFNVGSILRLIDNFGFSGLVHSTPELSFEHPQLVKSARGCQKWIPVRYEKDFIRYLETSTLPVIAVENDGDAKNIKHWSPPEKCILVLGNETYGIASSVKAVCDYKVGIPMFGFKNSMNVNHAFSIVGSKIAEKGII